MSGKYLWNKETDEVEECHDLMLWATQFGRTDNRIGENIFVEKDTRVSTVFLGLDHRFPPIDHPLFPPSNHPLLFETMVFGGEHDGYQERYSTAEEAREGHKRVVAMVIEEKEKGNDDGS